MATVTTLVPMPLHSALSPVPQSGLGTAQGTLPSLHAVLVWGCPPPICRCHHRIAAGEQSTLGPGGQNLGPGCPGQEGRYGRSDSVQARLHLGKVLDAVKASAEGQDLLPLIEPTLGVHEGGGERLFSPIA